jgi:valine dehydrogenase (NAD+)
MDIVARESEFVTGRSAAQGGAGDSSILTAFGVFQGMRAAAEHVWGEPTLSGRSVGVAGVGKVGKLLVDHLLADGAQVTVADINDRAIEQVLAAHPEVAVAADTAALVREPIDVYAPCALGSALDDPTVAALRARIVCGGANNQLEHPGVQKLLDARGVLYAPDYVVNSGGVIQVADEIGGFDFQRAKARVANIFDTTQEIFALAERDGVPPAVAADHLAERRMADIGRLRKILVDGPAALRRVGGLTRP